MSRWAHWSKGTEEKGLSLKTFLENTGNPSAAMGPAERARQLGLQSNGKGGYIDPATGQVTARTVNGELVFYDNNRATGGAISDGSGGAELTQAQPSWADPLTGMLTTPPSKAESPSEIAAIPDATPATAPFGYNAFMKQKKMAAYQQNAVEPQLSRGTPDEIEQENQEAEQQAEMGDAGEQPAFAAEDVIREEDGLDPEGLAKRLGNGRPQTMRTMVDKARSLQTAPQVQQKNTQTPAQPSAASRMASADLSKIPAEHRDDDFIDKPSVKDIIAAKRDGEELPDEFKDAITHRRDVLRKNPDAAGGDNVSSLSQRALSKVLKTTPDPEPVERETDPTPPQADNYVDDEGRPIGRRADHIWDSTPHLTELPGESASMQAIHGLLSNPDLHQYAEHLGVKPGSKEWKKLPEEAQEAIQGYYDSISDVLPTSHLTGSKWELSSAKQARHIFDNLREQFPDGIPQMDIMKPYEATRDEAMRLTSIPRENWDNTYDDMYQALIDKIGGDSQLGRVISAKGRNVRDVYDPTDISLVQHGKHDEIMEELGKRLEKIQASGEDGLSDGEIESLIRTVNDYKKELLESGAMRNISLKQVAGNQPGTYKEVRSDAEMPEVEFDAENFGIDFGFGPRSVQASRGGEFTDVLDFNNQGVNFPFKVGGKKMNVPIIPHPGGGPGSHNPFSTAGSTKSEPTMEGGGAKMGAIPITSWFDESLNTYSDGLLDKVGGLHEHLGVDEKGKMSGFSDEDKEYWMNMMEQARNHEGNIKLPDGPFSMMGEDTDFGGWLDGIRGLDDMIHQGRSPGDDFGDDEGLNDSQMNDGMFKNISREARDKIREQYGAIPFSQARQKMRTKLRSLRYLRLMQELENAGPETFNRFFQERIHNPANKILDLASPHYKAY